MQRDLPQTIDTPALLIDLPLLEKNLQAMADYCRNHHLDLRPHTKTHKSPHIAAMQLEYGAIGLVCAKLGEAEVMADAGLGPLLIANQLVGEIKLRRLFQLHRRADVTVCVARSDHVRLLADAAPRSAQPLKVFIEVDVGMQRCGLAEQTEVVHLARQITETPSVQLTGIMGYEGHAIGTNNLEQRCEKARRAHKKIAALARAIRDQSIDLPVISGVGTGTYNLSVSPPELKEIQPGSYALMDANYASYVNVQSHFVPAATVLSTVIDRPTDRRVVLDVGSKGITIDQGLPKPRWRKDLAPEEIHEEHYCLALDAPGAQPRIGDRIELLPTHICTTVNLYDQFHVIRDDQLVDTWAITARGKLA